MIYEAIRNGEVVKVKKCPHCLKYKALSAYGMRTGGEYVRSWCKKCEIDKDVRYKRKMRALRKNK